MEKKHLIVFGNVPGKYGADQGSLLRAWLNGSLENRQAAKQMLEKRIGHALSDKKVTDYFKNLAREGCGYAAATNIILLKYERNPAKFQSLYGISYYDKQGKVNFDELLLWFYQTEDNWRDLPFTTAQMWLPHPGVLGGDLMSNIQHFTKRYGEEIRGIALGNCDEARVRVELAQGKHPVLTCLFAELILYHPRWESRNQVSKWHTVVITGYDLAKKQFIVSSWGQKYYLEKLPLAWTTRVNSY